MDSKIDLKMAELLCSKLCHDLISPIGAINNGLEFLEDGTPDLLEDAKFLIGQSAKQAADRLAFFRIALGSGGGEVVEVKTIMNLITQFCGEKKLECLWSGADLIDFPNIRKANGKFLLNISLIAADCLPRGGQIEFQTLVSSDNPSLDIIITGDKCNLREDVKSGFESDLPQNLLSIRNVLSYYCMKLANICGKNLNFKEEYPSVIKFNFS